MNLRVAGIEEKWCWIVSALQCGASDGKF